MPEAEAIPAQDSLVVAPSRDRGDQPLNRFGSLYCSCDVCDTLIPQKKGQRLGSMFTFEVCLVSLTCVSDSD